ncbi:MAG: transglycosylase SLT domain-containing protein [Candidatus Delongbacteria bacterium]
MRSIKIIICIFILNLLSQTAWSYGYSFPDEINFAGQRVPLEKYSVAERLQKKFNTLINDRRGFIENLLLQKEKFIPYAAEILKNYDLHPDFAYIIPIASGFNNRAYSKSGASGPWQLMPATAKMYGLRVDNFTDERNLLFSSTEAAAEHLRMLSDIFNGDPFLILAAYNTGDKNLRKTLESQNSDNFWDIRTNIETESYVEKVIVYKMIFENYKNLGFKEYADEIVCEYETCVISLGPKNLYFTDICSIAGISYREFYELNPHIRSGSYKDPGFISKYTSQNIILPANTADILLSELREQDLIVSKHGTIYQDVKEELPDLINVHKVKYNENIESIAFKYGADWRELAVLNDLKIISLSSGIETARLVKGQLIRIIK